MPELSLGNLVNYRASLSRVLGAPVLGSGIDDDHFDGFVELLSLDPVEAADQVRAAVLDWNDDRDHRGVAASTN